MPQGSRQKREIPHPTFNSNDSYRLPRRYDLVWAQTVSTYFEMMDTEGWASQQSFSVASLNPFMSKVSLYTETYLPSLMKHDSLRSLLLLVVVLAFRSLGKAFAKVDRVACRLTKLCLSFLETLSLDWPLRIGCTSFQSKRQYSSHRAETYAAEDLPHNSLRELDEAYRVLSQYMKSFVSRKKEEIASEAYTVNAGNNDDLFTSLVRASGQDGKLGLSDEELVTFFL